MNDDDMVRGRSDDSDMIRDDDFDDSEDMDEEEEDEEDEGTF